MTLHYQDDAVTLHCGKAGDIVRELEPGSVQTVVTSPPYYGLRDYGDVDQLGAEKSVGEYVDRMRDVFEGVRQALADDGTVWLNLGDSYTGSWGAQSRDPLLGAGMHSTAVEAGAYATKHGRNTADVKRLAAEARVALGGYYREFLTGMTKNKRDVWTVSGSSFKGAHFAVYPPELIRPCILAGSRPGDVVLDPFSGSGTTGMVANQEGRRYVGIDLNAEYLDLSLRTRFAQPTLPMEAIS